MKKLIKKIPIVGKLAVKAKRKIKGADEFKSSRDYWEKRYGEGGTSGVGSYNELGAYKGDVINEFTIEHGIKSAIEHGCGDGNQLSYFKFETFTGYEISQAAIDNCKKVYADDPTKTFRHFDEYIAEEFDVSLSLDVIYCIIEDDAYQTYMERLFDSSRKYVIIYSTDHDKNDGSTDHIKHRKFSEWIKANRPAYEQIGFVKNKYNGQVKPFISDFYFYEKKG